MDPEQIHHLRQLDKRHFWHPFTQMRDWCAADHDPLILVSGRGAVLTDSEGKEYIDGNSSIWTNIHGHNHPVINAAIHAQLDQLAHCSALGFTNEPAIRLAEALVNLFPGLPLSRVFFSDDGSTAMECACKMALQYWQLKDRPERRRFVAFDRAYHGDTAGAASLGGIKTFHRRFQNWGFEVLHVEKMDCLRQMPEAEIHTLAAVAIEPLIQGAAGMRTWPEGMLRELREWCDATGVLLILDEVMTGFGRTGAMFACQREPENVVPDLLALAKGLTGGYLPLGATLTTEAIFEAFLGDYEELKTFFYGHSYCGNPLGCAAALASLEVFESENVMEHTAARILTLQQLLDGKLKAHPNVLEIRQCGLIAGIEIGSGAGAGAPFPWEAQTGARICQAARKHGVLTRPVGDTLVLMPPLCITDAQLETAVDALALAIDEVCSPGSR